MFKKAFEIFLGIGEIIKDAAIEIKSLAIEAIEDSINLVRTLWLNEEEFQEMLQEDFDRRITRYFPDALPTTEGGNRRISLAELIAKAQLNEMVSENKSVSLKDFDPWPKKENSPNEENR